MAKKTSEKKPAAAAKAPGTWDKKLKYFGEVVNWKGGKHAAVKIWDDERRGWVYKDPKSGKPFSREAFKDDEAAKAHRVFFTPDGESEPVTAAEEAEVEAQAQTEPVQTEQA